MTYTTREVEKLLGLRATQVRAFVRDGFLSPGRGPRGELQFTFQDLVLLRTARGLIDAEVPASRVRSALRRLRARLPEGAPLAGLRIHAEGRRIVVRDGNALFQPESGQAIFDFHVGELARGVESLERVRGRSDRGGAEEAVAKQPANGSATGAEGLYQRGAAIEDDDPDEAQACYERALALDAGHVEAHVNLGRLLHDKGDPEAAEQHYRAGLERKPDDVTAAFNLAVALEDLDRFDDAVAAYRRALAIDPGCADAHFNLARLFEHRGDRLAALRHLQSYRKLTRS